jgi:hypothetical protein
MQTLVIAIRIVRAFAMEFRMTRIRGTIRIATSGTR